MKDPRPRFSQLSWRLKILTLAFLIPAEIVGWTLFALVFLIAFIGSPRDAISGIRSVKKIKGERHAK